MALPEIRVGTSGYSFDDWEEVFYPPGTEKGKRLDHYVKFFPTVEINSTYYRIPHPAVMYNIVKKAPAGFDFMVKVPQSMTHRRTDLDNDVNQFIESVRPFEDAGMLSGLLAQYPYSFKMTPRALDYVGQCQRIVAPRPLYVEFRHDSWVSQAVFERLKAEGIGYVSVDEPPLPGLLKPDLVATTDVAYVRLHGRNSAQWWEGGAERYNYLYSDEELGQWQRKVATLTSRAKRVYMFFNNCRGGRAVSNALQFMRKVNT